jgi:hypothetical protein
VGTIIESAADAVNATLTPATYYYPVGGDASLVGGVHAAYNAALVGSVQLQYSNFPDAALNSAVAGEWVSTTGATAIPGGSAGGVLLPLVPGYRRCRLVVVVTTGGLIRARAHGAGG